MSRKVLDKKSTKHQTSSSSSSEYSDGDEEEGCEEVGEKVGEIEGSSGEEEEGSSSSSSSSEEEEEEEEEDSDTGGAPNGMEEEELDGLTVKQLHCYKMGQREEILTQLMSFANPEIPELVVLLQRYTAYNAAVDLITRPDLSVEEWKQPAKDLLTKLKELK
jgi:hypothetical protein